MLAVQALSEGQKVKFCRVDGSASELAAACSAKPKCKAFSAHPNGSWGYLKTGNETAKPSGGWSTFYKR